MVKKTQNTQEKIVVGHPDGLRIEISWEKEVEQCKTAAEVTLGSLNLWVGDDLLWGIQEEDDTITSIKWNWVELLEFLTMSWNYIVYEETYPIDIKLVHPGELREKARQRWQNLPEDVSIEEDKEIYFFEDSHDLSRGLNGNQLPGVLLMREGNYMWICFLENHILRPFDETINTLEDLGNLIIGRISGLEDQRSIWICSQWVKKANLAPESLLSLVTDLSIEQIREVQTDKSFEIVWEYDSDNFRLNELQAAARMASSKSSIQIIKSILNEIRDIAYAETLMLDELSNDALIFLNNYSEHIFYEQGYILANWLRKRQPAIVSPQGRVDPKKVLKSWGIILKEIEIDEDIFDAISCWGIKHGPAVLLNMKGIHNRTSVSRNSTYAHEICHLLIDRQGSLPLVEILGGNVPLGAERRANAFAAELLLPRNVVAEYVKANSDKEIENICKELYSLYKVSFHVIANQILNSLIMLRSEQRRYLENFRHALNNDLLL